MNEDDIECPCCIDAARDVEDMELADLHRTGGPANDNAKQVTILEFVQTMHDCDVPAADIMEQLIDAIASGVVGWGCDLNQVLELTRRAVIAKRGRGV